MSDSSSPLLLSRKSSFWRNQFGYTYMSLHTNTLQELTQCKSSAQANNATPIAALFYIQSQSERISAEECDCFTALLMSKSPPNSHTHITISHASCLWLNPSPLRQPLIPLALCPPPPGLRLGLGSVVTVRLTFSPETGTRHGTTVRLTESVYLHAWLRAQSTTWQEYQKRRLIWLGIYCYLVLLYIYTDRAAQFILSTFFFSTWGKEKKPCMNNLVVSLSKFRRTVLGHCFEDYFMVDSLMFKTSTVLSLFNGNSIKMKQTHSYNIELS